MNTNTNVADMRQDVLKIREDVSKIREDAGYQNRVVRDMRTLYRFSIHTDRCLGSGQVRNLDHREIRV